MEPPVRSLTRRFQLRALRFACKYFCCGVSVTLPDLRLGGVVDGGVVEGEHEHDMPVGRLTTSDELEAGLISTSDSSSKRFSPKLVLDPQKFTVVESSTSSSNPEPPQVRTEKLVAAGTPEGLPPQASLTMGTPIPGRTSDVSTDATTPGVEASTSFPRYLWSSPQQVDWWEVTVTERVIEGLLTPSPLLPDE